MRRAPIVSFLGGLGTGDRRSDIGAMRGCFQDGGGAYGVFGGSGDSPRR